MTVSPLFASALAFTIGYGVAGLGAEGGFVDNPKDPGGATYRGVTLATYRDYLGDPSFTVTQLKALADPALAAFYGAEFWNVVAGDALPPGVGLSVFDMAVDANPRHSARQLQQAVGAEQDGYVGPTTIAAAGKIAPGILVGHLASIQLAYYRALPTYPTFGRGWSARVSSRETAALAVSKT